MLMVAVRYIHVCFFYKYSLDRYAIEVSQINIIITLFIIARLHGGG